jgi:MFS family permease
LSVARKETREGNAESAGSSDSRRPAAKPRLSRGTIIIGVVSLLSDISTEMVYPVLPIFIKEVLKAPAAALGLIEGLANGTASVVTGFSGWISDHLGRRKPVAFSGYALTALSKPIIAFASIWQVVLGARFADRLGKGIRSAPKDALVAETATDEDRGRAFGFERMMDYSGAVAGPLAGFALLNWLGIELRTIFLLSMIPAAGAAALLLAIREPRASEDRHRTHLLRLKLEEVPRRYKLFLATAAVFGLANSANAFLILRAHSLGLETGSTILAYTLYNAVAAAASLPAGAASDRLGRKNLLVAGYLIYAVSYLGFGAADRAWLVWPLFALYGLCPALADGIGKVFAIETAGTGHKATAIGVYAMVNGLTQIVASFVGGMLWDHVSPSSTFYFAAAVAACAAVLLIFLVSATRPTVPNRASVESS